MPPRFLISGSGICLRKKGPKIAASPARSANTAAPTAKAALQRENKRPAYEAATPSRSRLKTRPAKKVKERNIPRFLRLPSGASSTCEPTKPTTPTPAGNVQGQVLVERTPPISATSRAIDGYCSTEAETPSIKSNGFINSLFNKRGDCSDNRLFCVMQQFDLADLPHFFSTAATRILITAFAFGCSFRYLDFTSTLSVWTSVSFSCFKSHFVLLNFYSKNQCRLSDFSCNPLFHIHTSGGKLDILTLDQDKDLPKPADRSVSSLTLRSAQHSATFPSMTIVGTVFIP